MLIILNENKYKEFKKIGKKPSEFCKDDLKMAKVKTYDFVFNYFSNSDKLVKAIREYHKVSMVKKGEYSLLELLK